MKFETIHHHHQNKFLFTHLLSKLLLLRVFAWLLELIVPNVSLFLCLCLQLIGASSPDLLSFENFGPILIHPQLPIRTLFEVRKHCNNKLHKPVYNKTLQIKSNMISIQYVNLSSPWSSYWTFRLTFTRYVSGPQIKFSRFNFGTNSYNSFTLNSTYS